MRLNIRPNCKSRKEYVEFCKLQIKDAQIRYQNKLVWQYKANGKGQRIGVAVAFVKDGSLYVGTSKCNRRLHDKFDRDIGLWQAIDRAQLVPASYPETPEELKDGLPGHRDFMHYAYPSSMHKLALRMIFRGRRQFVPKPAPSPEPVRA